MSGRLERVYEYMQEKQNYLGLLSLSILLGILISYLIELPFDIILNALSTDTLVWVTAAYVILTGWLVRETRNTRKQEVMPVINLQVESYSHNASGPKIENIGNGPAKDVDATIKLMPDGPQHKIRSKNIAPGGFTGSLEPTVRRDMNKKYDRMVINGEYTDVWNNRNGFKDDFDLKLLYENDGADSLMEQRQELRYLKNIERNLESIANSTEVEGLEKHLTIKNTQQIFEPIAQNNGITIKELCQETGLNPRKMAKELIWLDMSDAIDYSGDLNDLLSEENGEIEIFATKNRENTK